jgi:putative oxidoreductase
LKIVAPLRIEERHVKYAVLAGRQLFSIIFIIASAGHFNSQTIASAARHSVPLPDILVPLSGVMALAGGLSVLLGYQTRFGAWLLVIFLVPVTLMMHNFWALSDPATSQIEKAMFMKNVTMLGGALLISYFGAGPLSLDALLTGSRSRPAEDEAA